MMSFFDRVRFRSDLRRHEGVVLRVYADPVLGASAATCGVGHLIVPGDREYGQVKDHS